MPQAKRWDNKRKRITGWLAGHEIHLEIEDVLDKIKNKINVECSKEGNSMHKKFWKSLKGGEGSHFFTLCLNAQVKQWGVGVGG